MLGRVMVGPAYSTLPPEERIIVARRKPRVHLAGLSHIEIMKRCLADGTTRWRSALNAHSDTERPGFL